MNKQLEKSIEATEMWFLRRMMRIQRTEKRTNEDILRNAAHTRQLLNNTHKRKAKFIGHVLRKEKLKHLITTGKLDGRRGRGRQREKILDKLTRWMRTEGAAETITAARDREKWRLMTANAIRHGTG